MISEIEFDILNFLYKDINNAKLEEHISKKHHISLKDAHIAICEMLHKDLVTINMHITDTGMKLLEPYKVKNAIIMAAGMSTRFAPLSYEKPKALLKVKGELLIEREIRQLQEAGIKSITVVAGYMKEELFYLKDKYHVEIVVNEDYYRYNNSSTLMTVVDKLDNTYICSSDNYFPHNPFEQYVYHSYYSAVYISGKTNEYCITYDKNDRITGVSIGGKDAWCMIGHVYFDRSFSQSFTSILRAEYKDLAARELMWENIYICYIDKLDMHIRKYASDAILEFDTLEELRLFDKDYLLNSGSKVLKTICGVFQCEESDITGIYPIKAGMTNCSFRFSCRGIQYIMRVPGEGTQLLINRKQETRVYQAIEDKGLCDNTVYLNPENGCKITKFLDHVRVCDPHSVSDLKKCIKKLRDFHNMKLIVEHEFDIFEQIDFYESLWNGKSSVYKDYQETKQNVFSLKDYIREYAFPYCLTHIDAVPDNFLFYVNDAGEEQLQLTDWEYAGMQDPHVDIAMFCIYSFYNTEQVDRLIDIYFEGNCQESVRTKIYCYIAVCGLLWSNWCEYKRSLGVAFGEYALRQYQYAKEYYHFAKRRIENDEQ